MGRLRTHVLAVCCLLLMLEGSSLAHNGSVVLTSTVSNIVTDGDLSDWPDNLPSHPIAMNLYGDPLVGPGDCRGRFRVAVDPATKCLHLAIQIEDDSYVEAAHGHASWDSFDSCTAFVGLPHHPLKNRPHDSASVKLPVPTRFVRRTETGYNIELLYDLAGSGIETVDVPRTAAFSVTLNDRDADGSFTALFWSPEISKSIHTNRRGDLIINRKPTGRVLGKTTSSGPSDVGTSLIDFEAVDNPLLVFRLRTDPGGAYQVDLPPGTYRRSTHGAPTETITVVTGESSQDEIAVKSERTETRSLADYTLSADVTSGRQELYPKKVGAKFYEMTTVNGLPKSRITSLAQGHLGSLWIGTESSIARFDGTQLQVFDTDLVKDVNAFYFDKLQGQLWFAGENQVGFIRHDKVITFPMLTDQLASCVGRTHDNRICVGTRNGLFLWDKMRFRYQSTLNGLPHQFVTAIAADDRREVTWIGTQYGLVCFDGKDFELFDHESGLGDPRIVDLHVAKDGTVWIGTNSSLYTLDASNQFQLIRKHPTERVRYARSFAEAVDGTMYVAAYDGQLKIAPDGEIEVLQEGNCEAVTLDGDSQLWLAMENGALRRTDLGLQLVWSGTCSFVQTVGDQLWFVSGEHDRDWEKQRSRVVRFDKDTHESTFFDLSVEATENTVATHPVLITELHVTDKAAWVGTKFHGVFRLKDSKWQQHRLPGRSVFQVTAIVEDALQRVWIATTRDLYCVEDGETRLVKVPGRPVGADIQCIAKASDGGIAIGTLMGVFVLNPNGELVAQYRENEGLNSNATTSLMYDSEDRLWVGTLGGLHRIGDDGTANFDAENGLLKDHVAWFVRSWGREVWSGSVAGINRICTKHRVVQHLVGADGLGQGHIYSVAPDGDCIWLAGESGLWIYRRGHRRPYLVLDEVVAVEPLDLDADGIHSVTTDIKSVDYHFHAVSLKDRIDGTIYRYRLQGVDSEWRGVTTQNHVTIDVPPTGEYYFEAMAYDRDLLPSHLIRYKLIVGVPWLRISTQYGLVVAVCSCIALGILYFRRIKRERRNLESRVADRTRELWEEIRHREIAESERADLQGQLQHMQKMEALGTLATGVAHDFNNSLLAISGNAELALMSDCSFEKDALLEELLSVTNQAAGLTNSMLMFGGKAASEKQAVDICQAIRDAEKILRRTLPATIEFQSQVCLEPLYCDADVSQIQQVILNLAVNARDAMPNGGKITMTVERSNDMVRIDFADNGPGMAAPTLDRIFEPFYTEKPRGKGTGLGLSIVHGIIKDHGGAVVVQSRPGEGTEFQIALPMSEADRQEKAKPIRHVVRGHARVLLADDDETVRKALSRLLAAAGFDVHTVQDGHQLVERFREDQDFELLIVDVDMPHKNGWQALQEIRRSSDSEIAAIVISGLPTHECLQDANTLFVRKPFSLHDLTSQAARLLQESA